MTVDDLSRATRLFLPLQASYASVFRHEVAHHFPNEAGIAKEVANLCTARQFKPHGHVSTSLTRSDPHVLRSDAIAKPLTALDYGSCNLPSHQVLSEHSRHV